MFRPIEDRKTKSTDTPPDGVVRPHIEAMKARGIIPVLTNSTPEIASDVHNWAFGKVDAYDVILNGRKEIAFRDSGELPCSKDDLKIALLLASFGFEWKRALSDDEALKNSCAERLKYFRNMYIGLSMFQDMSQYTGVVDTLQNPKMKLFKGKKSGRLTTAQQQQLDDSLKAASFGLEFVQITQKEAGQLSREFDLWLQRINDTIAHYRQLGYSV